MECIYIFEAFPQYILPPFLGSCSPRSPCATTTRNCASPPRYCHADPPRPRTSPPARLHRRPLAHNCTPWRHTSSKTTPSLCPWRTSKNLYSTSVSGIVFAALAVCHHFAQLCVRYRYAGPPRPSTSRHTDPLQLLQWLCVVTTRPYCTRPQQFTSKRE